MDDHGELRSRVLPIYSWLWWATVPVLGLILWRAARHPESAFAIVVGGVLTVGLGLLIVPQLVYFLSRKSLHASSTAFFIICAWFSIYQLPPFDQVREERRRSEHRPKIASVLLPYVQQALLGPGEASVQAANGREHTEGLADRLEGLGRRLEGDARRAAMALAVVFRELADVEGDYFQAAGELKALDPFDLESMRSWEDFEARVSAADSVLTARRAYSREYQQLTQRIRRGLHSSGLVPREVEDILRILSSKEALAQEARMRDLELKFVGALRNTLVLLQDNREQWTLNPETGGIDFDSAELRRELRALQIEMRDAGATREAEKRRYRSEVERSVVGLQR